MRFLPAACVWLLACTTSDIYEYDAESGDRIKVKEGDTVLVWSSGDLDYAAARSDAMLTLPEFVSRFCDPPPNQTDLALKARFAELLPGRSDSLGEHVWINVLAVDGHRFTGTVESKPMDLRSISYHDTVTIDTSKVSDWYAQDGDTLVAGFTMRVRRSRLSAHGRAKYDSIQGFLVLPDSVEWQRRGIVPRRSDAERDRLTRSCS